MADAATPSSSETRVLIAPGTIWLVLGLLLALWLLVQLQQLVILLLISWLFAASLYPAVAWLENKRLPRGLSILVYYLVIIAAVLGIITMSAEVLIIQGGSLIENLPALGARAADAISSLPGLSGFKFQSILSAQNLAGQFRTLLLSSISYLLAFAQGIFSLVSILLLTFLMLMSSNRLEATLAGLFPVEKRARAVDFMRQASISIGVFIRGQSMVAAIQALLILVGLKVLHVPYAEVLALLSFILDFIPVVGSLVSSLFGILVALAQAPLLALWTALVYLVANQIETNLLSPLVLGKAIGLPPFWIIVSLIAGGMLYGIVGAFLAIPTALVVRLAIQTFYIEGYLNRSSAHSAFVTPGEGAEAISKRAVDTPAGKTVWPGPSLGAGHYEV